MAYTFRERVLDQSRRVMVYEVVPPEPHTTRKALERSASALAKTLVGFEDVDGIYVPEVIDESDRGSVIVRHLKVPAREFASFVRNSYSEDEQHRKKLIISHPFSYTARGHTEQWINETYNDAGIKNIIVVGPRHRHPDLPGMSVTEATHLIHDMNNSGAVNVFPGAICIDSRRKSTNHGVHTDEPERMVQKAKAGTMYFVSQICYDSHSMINLLHDYKAESDKQGTEVKRVFIGVSPITSNNTRKVVEDLMEISLGRELAEYLFSHDHGVGNRSMQRIEEMITRIFDYCYGENLGVPLGLCVEHVTDSNFRYALELLHKLPEIWKDYQPDSKFPQNGPGKK